MGRPKRDNLPSGIYKTPSGYKVAYKTVNKDTKYVHVKTLEEALELKEQYKMIGDLGIELNLKNPTITELFICHTKNFRMNKVAVTTLNSILRMFNNNVRPVFGNADIRDIRLVHLQKFADELQSKFSDRYSKKIMHSINVCYELAIYLTLIDTNLCKFIKWKNDKTSLLVKRQLELELSVTGDNNKRYVPYDMAKYYFNNFTTEPIFGKILEFQYETGMRCGEVLALTKDMVDFNNGLVKVFRTLSYDTDPSTGKKTFIVTSTKTMRSLRIIPVTGRALSILKSIEVLDKEFNILYSNVATQSEYIKLRGFFFTHNNELIKVNTVDSKLKTLLKNNNYEYLYKVNHGIDTGNLMLLDKHSSHDFRHTFLTNLWQQTRDPILLRDLAGHTSSEFTLDTYVTAPLDYMRDSIESLEI